MKEQKEKWIHESLITELPPTGMFRIRLDNEVWFEVLFQEGFDIVFIWLLPGDRIQIQVSRYDSTGGGIISRLRNKDSKKRFFNLPFVRI
uniref:Translation initiation factor 1 n=1 Tax=Ophiorrhiza pumila TaxID=157934 RepID=A0A891ZK15_9GENT|nr:translation initiation factor 1 [Ophiorrhiza pumila]QRN71546.1 translation initiation factor 1 [Ophiorrhiza pumila]